MRKTALNEQHRELKAKMVSFGGWDMPIQYEGVLAEHKHVRESVGVSEVYILKGGEKSLTERGLLID